MSPSPPVAALLIGNPGEPTLAKMNPAQIRYLDPLGDIVSMLDADQTRGLDPARLDRLAKRAYPSDATRYEIFIWSPGLQKWECTTKHDRTLERQAIQAKFAGLDRGRDRL